MPPAAVAGWSYGGDLASDLTGTSRAGRLVYAGSYPEPAQTRSTDEPIGLPGLLFHNDMTAELDTFLGHAWLPRLMAAGRRDNPAILISRLMSCGNSIW